MRKNWIIRLTTFGLWLLAAASVVYWTLRFVQGTATPAHAAVVTALPNATVDSLALARSLGGGLANATSTLVVSAQPSPPDAINATRFVLTGVVSGRLAHQGIALIGVDAKPARPYRVGAQVAEGTLLKSVQGRQAVLASIKGKAPALTLELPKLGSSSSIGTPTSASPAVAPAAPVVSFNPTSMINSATPTPPPGLPASPSTGDAAAVAAGQPTSIRGSSGRLRALREAGKELPKEEQPVQAGVAH